MRKVLAILLIILGLMLISYPKAAETYYMYKQKKLLIEWQLASALDNREGKSPSTALVTDEKESLTGNEEGIDNDENNNTNNSLNEYISDNMEAILRIEKIGLEQPILTGITEKNLQISIASMEQAAGGLGRIGNYIIAGHRNHSFGRNFNRLDELNIGDGIEVDDGNNIYIYGIVEKLYVLPDETWVYNSDSNKKEVTLITCHPMINPTHRLIIKGELSEAKQVSS